MKWHAMASDVEFGHHAAKSANASGKAFPFFAASSRKAGSRQLGIELFNPHPETVDTGRPSSVATATIPPRSSFRNCLTVTMRRVLRKT